MEKSAIIIRSENGKVTYVIGEVLTKSAEELSAEIESLENQLSHVNCIDVESVKQEYDAKIEALKAEAESAIEKALEDQKHADEEVKRLSEEIDNLNAVLSTLTDSEKTEISKEDIKAEL